MQRSILPLALFSILLGGGTTAVAFRPPLTGLQAWLETNGFAITVRYQVYDPALQAWRANSRRYDGHAFAAWAVLNLTVADGAVAWRAVTVGDAASRETEVRYAVYDPARTGWFEGRRRYAGNVLSSWLVTNLTVKGGVIAWRAVPTVGSLSLDTEVAYAVYDPARGAWRDSQRLYDGDSLNSWVTTNLTVADGLVVWRAVPGANYQVRDTEIGCAFYDAARGTWKETQRRYAGTTLSSWVTTNLTVADNLVAWRAVPAGSFPSWDTQVGFAIYDPSRAAWMNGQQLYEGQSSSSWSTAGLGIGNHTVQWTASKGTTTISERRGYDVTNGLWYAGPNTVRAEFVVSTNARPPPLRVWFGDLSLGATNWSWNFGNGRTSKDKSPYQVFDQIGAFPVTLTISGPGGTSSLTRTIITDLAAPVGVLLINGGATATISPAVVLTLAATDDSGTVATMRFSNDGVLWSDWEAYHTNKVWDLTPGNGLKTVSAQAQDAAGNVSVTISSVIVLDLLVLEAPPQDQAVVEGVTARFSVLASSVSPLLYQWHFNEAAIPGATNASLAITNVGLADEGTYHVVVSNSAGSTNAAARLQVLGLVRFESASLQVTNGHFSARVAGLSGPAPVVMFASTNLVDWQPIATNLPVAGALEWTAPLATNRPAQFYRAFVP